MGHRVISRQQLLLVRSRGLPLIDNIQSYKFVPITLVDFAVVAGGDGWVDTDISTAIPVNTKAILWRNYPENADCDMGVRAVGESVNQMSQNAWILMARVSNHTARRVELFRNAAQTVHYGVMGYWI